MSAAALVLAVALAGPPPPSEVTALPPGLLEQMHAFLSESTAGVTRTDRLRRLVEFMFDDDGLGLEYDDEVTRTVAETVGARRGNCLSFTLTFVALARAADLNAYVQEFDEALVWYRHEDMIYHTTHVNAGVQVTRDRYTVDFDRTLRLTRIRPNRVSDERALAHYYNNRGAELMGDGHLDHARAWFDRALAIDDSYPATWNNLGVLHARDGDAASAERAYLRALDLAPEHTSALSNVAELYRSAGDDERADRYEARLARVRSYDPFHLFVLGLKHEMRGDLAAARDALRRAIRLHAGEHEFHFALARVLYGLGDTRRAARALSDAERLAAGDDRTRYRAKLEALRAEARP